jgi:hypothetical protein
MTCENSHGSSFLFTVEDAFRFADGSTVIVGVPDVDDRQLVPSDATVLIDGQPLAHIRLTEERMPGPNTIRRRALVTRDSVDVDLLKGRKSVLLCRR